MWPELIPARAAQARYPQIDAAHRASKLCLIRRHLLRILGFHDALVKPCGELCFFALYRPRLHGLARSRPSIRGRHRGDAPFRLQSC